LTSALNELHVDYFVAALANVLDTIVFGYIILVFVFYGVLKAIIAVCLNLNLNKYDV